MRQGTTAHLAAKRLRSVLATDRCLIKHDTVKFLNADVLLVLAQYFSVSEATFTVDRAEGPDGISYKLEAQLAPMS